MLKDIPLFITLDRISYESGSQVNGSILLRLHEPIRGYGIKLSFIGEEYVHFTLIESVTVPKTRRGNDGRTEHFTETERVPKEHQKYRVFYSTEQLVATFADQYIPPGDYQYPFSFALGVDIPNSFQYVWKTEGYQNDAIIRYNLTAKLVDKNNEQVARESLKYLTIQNTRIQEQDSVKRIDKSVNVTMNCCKNGGKLRMVTYFEKDRYYTDEDVWLVCELDNSQGEVAIKEGYAVLKEELQVKTGSASTTVEEQVKGEVVELRLGKGSRMTGNNAVRLKISVKPPQKRMHSSVYGELIRCTHSIKMILVLDACCSTSPTSHINVMLFDRPHSADALPTSFSNFDYSHTSSRPFVFQPVTINSGSTPINTNYPSMEW